MIFKEHIGTHLWVRKSIHWTLPKNLNDRVQDGEHVYIWIKSFKKKIKNKIKKKKKKEKDLPLNLSSSEEGEKNSHDLVC